MSFYEEYSKYKQFDFEKCFADIRENDILRILAKETLTPADFLSLLAPQAYKQIELMAKKSRELTQRNFGKVISLYAPIYLSNFCENECAYCGFRLTGKIARKKLSFAEVEKEARVISAAGIQHVLILTGESRKQTPVSYLQECVKRLGKYFNSISIEVYPLETSEYQELIDTGVEGLTIYQETYDEAKYLAYHLKGPKQNYIYRISAPERACEAGMRSVSLGALLGLSEPRKEIFFAGLHASYLQDNYPDTEISVSFPRIQTQNAGNFSPPYPVSDKNFVQFLLAMRIFLPRSGINISTRESSAFRKNLIGLGVTKMSAGSVTVVGGYSLNKKNCGQFNTADKSSVREVKAMICEKGYQPVLKDWHNL